MFESKIFGRFAAVLAPTPSVCIQNFRPLRGRFSPCPKCLYSKISGASRPNHTDSWDPILRSQVFVEKNFGPSRPNHSNTWGPISPPQLLVPKNFGPLRGQIKHLGSREPKCLYSKSLICYFRSVINRQLGPKHRGGRSLGVGSLTWNPPDERIVHVFPVPLSKTSLHET